MAIDGLFTRIADEGQNQEPGQGQFLRVAKLRQSNGHADMAFGRLVAIGAEQPVPPWQIKSAIAVGFADVTE